MSYNRYPLPMMPSGPSYMSLYRTSNTKRNFRYGDGDDDEGYHIDMPRGRYPRDAILTDDADNDDGHGIGHENINEYVGDAKSGPSKSEPGIKGYGEGGRSFVTRMRLFFVDFLQSSSVHGFVYLSAVGLRFSERVLWFAFICIAFFSITSLSQRIWERFQHSPIVVSMDRNKYFWNTSFPTLTVCPHNRIDSHKLENYIRTHAEVFPNDTEKEDFRNFITKLANVTYWTFDELPMNKTFGIRGSEYLDLIYRLKWDFQPEMSSATVHKLHLHETITELGICYTVNSQIAEYSSYDYWKQNLWTEIEHPPKITVHPLDGEIYAQIINLSTSYDVYFHGAMEVPDISRQRYTFYEADYTTIELFATEIYASEGVKDYKISQRRCRFPHEAETLFASPTYSTGLCHMECRMKLAMKMCNCVPHFYRTQVKGGQVLPTCDFEGFKCLSAIKNKMISLNSDGIDIECDCYANCDDSMFFVQLARSRVWFLGANLQWGITNYPKMQLRREILFAFTDVLVYIGGLAGFFLGSSLLSFTEIIYFFTVRLIRAWLGK